MKKILVVSQENYIGELLCAELREEGYRVILAGTGEEAAEDCLKESPDLVLIDTVLSRIDLPHALRCFQGKSTTSPIVIWSAYDFRQDESWPSSDAVVMNTPNFFKIKVKIKELCPLLEEAASQLEKQR